ncbi:hypothetical protein K8S19_10640 [bacterium]|nr:hypothetical protein [bacterium]
MKKLSWLVMVMTFLLQVQGAVSVNAFSAPNHDDQELIADLEFYQLLELLESIASEDEQAMNTELAFYQEIVLLENTDELNDADEDGEEGAADAAEEEGEHDASGH